MVFASNNSTYCHPILVKCHDDSLDQEVLRVVKTIRRRAGLPMPYEAKSIITKMVTPKVKHGRASKKEQHIQSLPKYNVEVQTDSPYHSEKPLVPSVSITRKFPMRGFRDEFDYVDYEYNDENQLPHEIMPQMIERPQRHGFTDAPDPIRRSSDKFRRPDIIKRPSIMVDTFLAAQVKSPDSPTRHIQQIEGHIGTNITKETSSVTSSPSVVRDLIISPINIQPYSFTCSANIGKNFVTPKENVATTPKILMSFTEATDNETVDLSVAGDIKSSNSISFWNDIVDRIMGTIFPTTGDDNDNDIDDTVLLTARAKYEDFFEGISSPISTMSPDRKATTLNVFGNDRVAPLIRSQLPQKDRTTLLHDFLDHILGPDKNVEDNDDTIAGESYADELQPTKPYDKQRSTSRPLLKSIDASHVKKAEDRKSVYIKSASVAARAPSKPTSHRRRSKLHDIVDDIVDRLSSSTSDLLYPRQQRSRRLYTSRLSTTCDREDDIDDDDDDDDSDDDGHDSVTDVIAEISIPSYKLSADTSIDKESDCVSTSVLSIGRHKKSSKVQALAFLDELESDNDDDDRYDRYGIGRSNSEESSIFTFESKSFAFN